MDRVPPRLCGRPRNGAGADARAKEICRGKRIGAGGLVLALTLVMAKALAATLSVLMLLTFAGCASEVQEEDTGENDDALTTRTRSVALQYEGTCDFLRECSSWSRSL